ncbi:MAG: M28 family peptidase, partial [Planctomycetota bacterium]
NAAAAEWIATRLAALGLEPAGESGTYFQSLPIELPARDGGDSWIEWDAPHASIEPKFGAPDLRVPSRATGARSLLPLFCSENSDATRDGKLGAPLVFAGYGLVCPEKQWDDFAGLDVRDCVVLVARGVPSIAETAAPQPAAPAAGHGDVGRGAGDESWGASASILFKCISAKQRGARAVLVAQPPKQGGEPLLAFDPGQGGRAGIPCLMVSAAVAEDLAPGYTARLRAIERAGAPVRDPLAGTARNVRVRAHVVREDGTTRNVLGLARGTGSAAAGHGGTVVVGAHFDHLGTGGHGALDPTAIGQVHNGADDNASGTAVALEIARLLRERKPARDVLIALWSGEEEGLLGSQHWVRAPTLPLADVRANVNLDMVGRAGNGKLQVLGVGTSAPFAAWMGEAGRAAGLEIAASLSGQGLGGSDHQSFLAQQIPALHLFSGTHSDYHRPSDDTERVEAAGMAKVTAFALDLVARMHAAPQLAYSAPPATEPATPGAARGGGGFAVWFGSVPDYAYDGGGVRINGTSSGSPAERAGFLPGDVLLRIGEIAIGGMDDFVYALRTYRPGNVVRVVYRRGEREEETRVTLSTRAIQ